MKYAELRPSLQTGDLALFSGRGLVSDGIKLFTRSRWSHVGMILRADALDLVLLWESTTLGTLPDVEDGLTHRGVQTVDFSRRVASYPGSLAVRRLIGRRTPEQLAAVAALRHELNHRPYEEHFLNLFRAECGEPKGDDLSSLFCSEMVGAAWRAMKLIPPSTVVAALTPADFSTERATHVDGVDRLLGMGYTLDSEIAVTSG